MIMCFFTNANKWQNNYLLKGWLLYLCRGSVQLSDRFLWLWQDEECVTLIICYRIVRASRKPFLDCSCWYVCILLVSSSLFLCDCEWICFLLFHHEGPFPLILIIGGHEPCHLDLHVSLMGALMEMMHVSRPATHFSFGSVTFPRCVKRPLEMSTYLAFSVK